MAGIRPAKCYRWDSPAYTRTANNPGDAYISGVPASKINHFDMGNKLGDFDTQASIVFKNKIQLRHNALEAARIAAQYTLEKKVGLANYFFKIRVFPHHIMRQNVQAIGAGADRVSDGMRRAFGKPIGRAARVSKNQKVFTVYYDQEEQRQKMVKKALDKARKKLPPQSKIVIEEADND